MSERPLEVSVAPRLLAKARADFTAEGSLAGAPSFELFERGPLAAARLFFARQFESAPAPVPGAGAIRQWDVPSRIFGPLVFYAVRAGSGIEVVDYLYDPDYWDTVADDPVE